MKNENDMMEEDDSKIKEEAVKEKEPVAEEEGEYSHIKDFVDTLDKEELAYLKGCLKNHKVAGDTAIEDKEVSEKTFED